MAYPATADESHPPLGEAIHKVWLRGQDLHLRLEVVILSFTGASWAGYLAG